MKTTFLLTIFSAILFLSCGKSKYEKEMDQIWDDYDKEMEQIWDDYDREMEQLEYELDYY